MDSNKNTLQKIAFIRLSPFKPISAWKRRFRGYKLLLTEEVADRLIPYVHIVRPGTQTAFEEYALTYEDDQNEALMSMGNPDKILCENFWQVLFGILSIKDLSVIERFKDGELKIFYTRDIEDKKVAVWVRFGVFDTEDGVDGEENVFTIECQSFSEYLLDLEAPLRKGSIFIPSDFRSN